MPSVKLFAPVGISICSCIEFSCPACFPPLITLHMGTGNLCGITPNNSPMYRYSGMFLAAAPALVIAIETGSIALAPNLSLFPVPSNLIIILSIVS